MYKPILYQMITQDAHIINVSKVFNITVAEQHGAYYCYVGDMVWLFKILSNAKEIRFTDYQAYVEKPSMRRIMLGLV